MSNSSIWNSNTAHRHFTQTCVAVVATVILGIGGAAAWAREVPKIYGTIYTSSFQPFRVGVDQFHVKSGNSSPEVYAAAQTISDVVLADLDFSYLFESVRPDTLYLRIMGLSQIDRRGWHHLGANFLVEGEVGLEGEDLVVTYTLTDVETDRELYRRELRTALKSVRLLAHNLSDEVYHELARANGIFQTELVYVHDGGTYKEIHICDYDGANDYGLQSDRALLLTPRWAGRDAVSYTSFKDGNPDVWIYDLVKDRSMKFSSTKGLNSGCSWTPDGKKYVISLSLEGNPEIYIGTRGSKSPQRLTFDDDIETSPTFSPDGKRIVFTSDRSGDPQLFIMDADGANVERLTYEGKYNDSPNWSPTLDVIAFAARDEGVFQICTIQPDGSGLRRLTEVGSNENPHWSPDGLHIVFSSNRTGTYEIYTMNYDGSGVRRVTTNGGNTNPDWSP